MKQRFVQRLSSLVLSVGALVSVVVAHNPASPQQFQTPSQPLVLAQAQVQPAVTAVESVGMTWAWD
jgi:hypothetical protein